MVAAIRNKPMTEKDIDLSELADMIEGSPAIYIAMGECLSPLSLVAKAAIITRLRARAPEGWQYVPVEPTPAMIAGAYDANIFLNMTDEGWRLAYRAMLAASPEPGSPWQTMESAPKDGTRILLWTPDLDPPTIQAQWRSYDDSTPDVGCWVDVWNNDMIESAANGYITPMRWMPLPAGPLSAPAPQGEA